MSLNVEIIFTYKLEKIWRKTVLAYFKIYYSRIHIQRLEKSKKNFKNRRILRLGSNLVLSEYSSEALPIEPTNPAQHCQINNKEIIYQLM
jgi:hypothetical protein